VNFHLSYKFFHFLYSYFLRNVSRNKKFGGRAHFDAIIGIYRDLFIADDRWYPVCLPACLQYLHHAIVAQLCVCIIYLLSCVTKQRNCYREERRVEQRLEGTAENGGRAVVEF